MEMIETSIQTLLGRILESRIDREKTAGTLESNKSALSNTLKIFLDGDKITPEQYAILENLITT